MLKLTKNTRPLSQEDLGRDGNYRIICRSDERGFVAPTTSGSIGFCQWGSMLTSVRNNH